MSICDLSALDRLLEKHPVPHALDIYIAGNTSWVREYTDYWRRGRRAEPVSRMTKLLEIVRYNGWNMNRQGQCGAILSGIADGKISRGQLTAFWSRVDGLARHELRELPAYPARRLGQMGEVLDWLAYTLGEWHPSAGTITFLSKVVLMFNWGQTPALDSRVRNVLGLRANPVYKYVDILVDLGRWVTEYERRERVKLDEQVTDYVAGRLDEPLGKIPVGRALDMVLFSLADWLED